MSISLKQDVYRQEAPSTLAANIESSKIEQYLPLEVRYTSLLDLVSPEIWCLALRQRRNPLIPLGTSPSLA
jgi:hypothetical protein